MRPIRLRDFIVDRDGWIYSVAAYDNARRVGGILRYVPDPSGERCSRSGQRYRKLEFDEAYDLIRREKPGYLDRIHRVPRGDVAGVKKPEVELPRIAARDRRVRSLVRLFSLPRGSLGCTGSRLIGLEAETSDIDLVVYGNAFSTACDRLRRAIAAGEVQDLSEEMWRTVYRKRSPELSFDEFVLHEQRKWNRGEIGGTYFDLLYTRGYDDLETVPVGKGDVRGPRTIQAVVTDATHAFDSPAVYRVKHPEISCILSFTHTYSGQALTGEVVDAQGIAERHGEETWLVVGTTRMAKGEWIRSRTLLEENPDIRGPG
ncbi:MAG: nucleotidyltransferase domain-containing protein [Methanomicrobiales archaeon]|nr:nucleotidyltransferase domain-containing protein [Methanomicrobiales archaeon]